MVNLERRVIQLAGDDYEITSFEVWWFIPGKGLFRHMDEAVQGKHGSLVIPTPVAVHESEYTGTCKVLMYEVIPGETCSSV